MARQSGAWWVALATAATLGVVTALVLYHSPPEPSSLGQVTIIAPCATNSAPTVSNPSSSAHNSSAGAVFGQVYSTLAWGDEGGGSGPGSGLQYTSGTRLILELLIHRYAVQRLLDAPCGSAFWWPPLLHHVRSRNPCFIYHGVDVVPSLISRNRVKFERDGSLTQFHVADLSSAVIGSYAANRVRNVDIPLGDYYPINVRLPPFNMTGAVEEMDEMTRGEPPKRRKFLYVFTREYLATLDFGRMRAGAAYVEKKKRLPVVNVTEDGVVLITEGSHRRLRR